MAVKAGYKQTEIGVIPEDWKLVQLSEIGECLIGLTYSPQQVRSSGTLVLRSSNIQNDKLNFKDNVFVDAEIPDRIMAREGDILICVRNGSRNLIGKAALLDKRTSGMTFGAFMSVFRSEIGGYLIHLLQSEIVKRQISEHLGATINQITNASLNSFRAPIPPLPEQQAIAQALSDVDELIARLDQLIEKRRALKTATMQQLLTGKTRLAGFSGEWQQKTFGNLGNTYGGLTGKTKSDFGIGDAKYVTFMNVMSNVLLKVENFEHVAVKPEETQNRVRQGDLLFNGSSETPEDLALCSFVGVDVDELFLNSFCFGFRLKETSDADGRFLAYYVRSDVGRKIMQSLAQGSTRYNVSKSAFLKAKLHLPPSHGEQVAIAATLSDMDAELTELAHRRDKTIALKQGMMQELLTGRTRLV